ncbi:transcriptional regulator [Gemmata sp.]|uniref:transcriptional regulator n=1 Tax=Gemmata sp. TaxID=1914242 RepID=UPI003F6FD873
MVLDPVIHEPARLAIVSVLAACGSATFTFVLGTTGLTRGNLSAHAAKLVAAGYAAESKRVVDRRLLTEYRLTDAVRGAFDRYRAAWARLTSGGGGTNPAE